MKRILALLLIMSFILTAMPTTFAAIDTKDPFLGISAKSFDDKKIRPVTVIYDVPQLAGANIGDWFVYKNVNFSQAYEKFEMTVGVPKGYDGKTLELRIDKPDGPLLGTVKPHATQSWGHLEVNEGKIENYNVRGIHDVYLIFATSQGQVGTITFYPIPKGIIKTNDNKTISFDDVLNTPYEKAVNVLSNLGIVYGNEGKFKPGDPVTRAEFTVFVTRMMGLNDIEKSGTGNVFKDVSKEHWAVGSIEAASNIGMISGYEDGTFAPDDYVSYNDAIKMIVCALGYKEYAISKGGYPSGFLSVASEIGILKNIKVNTEDIEIFKRGMTAQTLYNALSSEYMEAKGYGNSITYEKTKDIGILGKVSNIYKRKGIVTGTAITRLTSADTFQAMDEVEIDGERFKVNKSDISKYLGYYVEYYYKVDKSTGNNVVLYAEPYNNEEYLINYNDDVSINNNKINFTPKGNDKQKSLSIIPGTAVIYNGKAMNNINYDSVLNYHNIMVNSANPTNTINIPFSGKIKWLDNNGDGNADVLFTESPIVYVMNGYGGNTNRLEDLYKKPSLNFDIMTDDVQLIVTKNGLDASYYEIRKNSIITVYQSFNAVGKKLIRFDLSDNSVMGKIDEIANDTTNKLVINGNQYELANEYSMAVEKNISGIKMLELGMQGEFKLDALGRIAYYNNIVNNDSSKTDNEIVKTGILIKYAIPNSGIDPIIEFKIFSESGKTIICKGSKNITFDGEKISNITALRNRLSSVPNLLYSVIRYKLNSEGSLDFIDTYRPNGLGYNGVNDTLNLVTRDANGNRPTITTLTDTKYLRKTGRYFGLINANATQRNYSYTKDNIAFLVPDVSSNDRDNEQCYSIVNINNFTDGHRFFIESYNNDINSEIGEIIVIYKQQINTTTVDDYRDCMIVDKITNVVDSDGDISLKVSGYLSGAEKSLIFSTDRTNDPTSINPALLQKGDVFRFKYDNKGRVLVRERLIDINNLTAATNTPGETPGFLFGRIANLKNGMMSFVDKASKIHTFIYDSAKVLTFDRTNNKLEVSNIDDLINYQNNNAQNNIFVYIDSYVAKMIVIYEN